MQKANDHSARIVAWRWHYCNVSRAVGLPLQYRRLTTHNNSSMNLKARSIRFWIAICVLLLTSGCSRIQESLLFHPTHNAYSGSLTPWTKGGAIIGYARQVESPKTVWLMLHGNAGQAADRVYALPHFAPADSVYILEYPGYGKREGVPSKDSFNDAAKEAYLYLRASNPTTPIGVVGESIGSGPAAFLASLPLPPDKLVLVVPFDQLSLVAEDHFPSLMVSLVMQDDWNNIQALNKYRNPVEIFGARDDVVIPVRHAKALAAMTPSSKFVLIGGGHNDWSQSDKVHIRNP